MDNCIFCKVIRGEANSWKVYENGSVYAFLDINPATRYHTLVIPKNHYTNIFDIPESELHEVMSVVKKIAGVYKEQLGLENIQILSNTGALAQQTVFHIHFHIVPRTAHDGQNWNWQTHPEWRTDFDAMLKQLNL